MNSAPKSGLPGAKLSGAIKPKELAVAEAACLAAGKIAMKYFRGKFTMRFKSPGNIVTQADVEAEQAVKKIILKAFARDSFLGEEEGKDGDSDRVWLIDPIDGTTNFTHGVDYFCTSIGLESRGELVCGAVYNPVHKKLYSACKGRGAWLNGKRIFVSKTARLADSLAVTGFPYNNPALAQKTLLSTGALYGNCRDIRRFGSAALDLCTVAEGICDSFFEYQLNPWDVGAGIIIVREAGGTITDCNGKDADPRSGHFLATNGLLHQAVLEKLERV